MSPDPIIRLSAVLQGRYRVDREIGGWHGHRDQDDGERPAPHFLPLFDSGEAGGVLFGVMPHVEGESLREKLDRETQLGVEDAIGPTRKVADGLDHEHDNCERMGEQCR